jgi:hypothetical protein
MDRNCQIVVVVLSSFNIAPRVKVCSNRKLEQETRRRKRKKRICDPSATVCFVIIFSKLIVQHMETRKYDLKRRVSINK